ncbi:hypothetical protein Tco_0884354 [Tanacetum coccineum]
MMNNKFRGGLLGLKDFKMILRVTAAQDVKVILPKKSQTILDAPLGYVGLYTYHFSLSNLRLPISPFICEVLNYFKVHIFHFNPFGMVKLTTFTVMCKAYRGELSVDLLRSFLNLGPAGDWLTLSNRGSADVPNENKLDKKSFKDKVPLHPEMDPLYDQIATYPCIVRNFLDPILYLAGLKTTWEHSPKRPVIYHRGTGLKLSICKICEQRSSRDWCYSPIFCLPTYREGSKKLKILSKRNVASGVPRKALSPKVQNMPVRASKVAGEAFTPMDVDSDSDIYAKELRDATDCHWVVAHVTPSSWKQHLREISIEQLCDIHDRAYMRHAVRRAHA